jgi:uncharacterized protein YraI
MDCKYIRDSSKRIFGMLLLLTLATWSVSNPAAGITMVSVSGEKVNLRKGPSTRYPIIWELGKGFPLKVIGFQILKVTSAGFTKIWFPGSRI